MPAATKESVARDLRRLHQAVNEAVGQSPTTLDAIGSVLRLASEAVEAISSQAPSGAYQVPLSPEQLQQYFLSTDWVGREVTPDEVREANTQWEAALQRGRAHRQEALQQLGPLLKPRQVAERLGVSTVTVNNWRRKGKLLAMRFDDHQYLYPLFQFTESPAAGEHGALRGLAEVLTELRDTSGWERAQFFLTEAPFLDGRTPLELLRSGRREDVERVCRLARCAGEMGS